MNLYRLLHNRQFPKPFDFHQDPAAIVIFSQNWFIFEYNDPYYDPKKRFCQIWKIDTQSADLNHFVKNQKKNWPYSLSHVPDPKQDNRRQIPRAVFVFTYIPTYHICLLWHITYSIITDNERSLRYMITPCFQQWPISVRVTYDRILQNWAQGWK